MVHEVKGWRRHWGSTLAEKSQNGALHLLACFNLMLNISVHINPFTSQSEDQHIVEMHIV